MSCDTEIKIANPDLVTRNAARKIFAQICDATRSGQVVIDLSEVLSISDAYADEVFGVLTSVYGLDWLLSHVRVIANEDVLQAIAEIVKRRATEVKTARR